jgi:hypothetical protein
MDLYWKKCCSGTLSKEVEKRLETLSQDLNKVITVLDSLHSDLQKISRDVCNSSMECMLLRLHKAYNQATAILLFVSSYLKLCLTAEGIKEKMMLQESSIQLLVLVSLQASYF